MSSPTDSTTVRSRAARALRHLPVGFGLVASGAFGSGMRRALAAEQTIEAAELELLAVCPPARLQDARAEAHAREVVLANLWAERPGEPPEPPEAMGLRSVAADVVRGRL